MSIFKKIDEFDTRFKENELKGQIFSKYEVISIEHKIELQKAILLMENDLGDEALSPLSKQLIQTQLEHLKYEYKNQYTRPVICHEENLLYQLHHRDLTDDEIINKKETIDSVFDDATKLLHLHIELHNKNASNLNPKGCGYMFTC